MDRPYFFKCSHLSLSLSLSLASNSQKIRFTPTVHVLFPWIRTFYQTQFIISFNFVDPILHSTREYCCQSVLPNNYRVVTMAEANAWKDTNKSLHQEERLSLWFLRKRDELPNVAPNSNDI